MKKYVGFALLVFAIGCVLPLTIINRKNVDEKYGHIDTYWINTAKNIDIWGNAEFKATWDKELITARIEGDELIYPYKFGVVGETISEVLQRNYELDTLTKKGKQLYNIINRIDPGHFENL